MLNGVNLNDKQTKFLINLIKSGKKTRQECIESLNKSFGRTINIRSLSGFARRHNLVFREVQKDAWSEREEAIARGLWLIGAGQERKILELPSRGLRAIQKKLQNLTLKGILNKDMKNKIDKDIQAKVSSKEIAKKYIIEEKFVKEYSDKQNKIIEESTVEIENLKRWEDNDVEDVLDGIEKQQEKLRKLDSEQGMANITIKTKNKYVALMFLSDIHLENVNTDIKQLRSDIDIIKNTKDFYVGFGGDIIDNFYVSNHSDGLLEALIPPKVARIVAGKLLDKLRGKMLWTILGCHDSWDLSTADYCLPEHIARKLKIPYLGHGGDINLKLNNIEYFLHCRHKYRGTGGDNGTACCKNVLRNIDAKFDLVSIGHNHVAEIKIEHFLGKPRIFVRNGSYKTQDRYSKSLGYVNNDFNIQIPVSILNTETKEMKIVSGVKSASDMLTALNRTTRK